MNNPIFASQPMPGVSNKYGFVSTQKVLGIALSQGFNIVTTRVNKPRKIEKEGYQKHCVILRHPDYVMPNGDELRLYIINSHDKSTSVQLHLGYLRSVCNNGLVFGDSLFSARVLHTGQDLETRLVALFTEAITAAKTSQGFIERMQGLTLSLDESVNLAYRALVILQKYRKIDGVSAVGLLTRQREADAGQDLWTVFNVIQEWAVNGGFYTQGVSAKGRLYNRKARKIKSLQADVALNKELFDLVVDYLEELTIEQTKELA